jgi:hypothetical protein
MREHRVTSRGTHWLYIPPLLTLAAAVVLWAIHTRVPDLGRALGLPVDVLPLQWALLLASVGLIVLVPFLRRTLHEDDDGIWVWLLWTLLVVHAGFVGVHLWDSVTYRIPGTWTEDVIFLGAARSPRLADLYLASNLDRPPFQTWVYTPGYYVAQRLIFPVLGETVAAGRAISIAAMLACATLLTFIRQARTPGGWGWLERLFPGFLFLAILLRYATSSIARPDFLAAALSLAGVVVYLRHLSANSQRRSWFLPASVLCGLALLTKQAVFAAPTAIGLHLLLRRRFGEAVTFGLLTLAWPAVFYAALWAPTEGGVLLMTMAAIGAQYDFVRVLEFAVIGYVGSPFVIIAFTAGLLLMADRERSHVDSAGFIYFIVGLGWFVVMVGRPGSSHNYFVEAAVAGALLIGLLLHRYAARDDAGARRMLLVVLVVMLTAHLVPQATLTMRRHADALEQQSVARALRNLRTSSRQYVLADVFYVLEAARAGLQPLVLDSYALTKMSDSGAVDPQPILEYLRTDRVPYLVLQNSLEWHEQLKPGDRYWPREILDYLRRAYTCETVLQQPSDGRLLVICEYRPTPSAP